MYRAYIHNSFMLLYILSYIFTGLPFNYGSIDSKVLNVGEELWKETLPLQMGSRFYQLQGLESNTWYEVKISYPASIPSSFSIELKRGNSDMDLNRGRKLLNTEKLIFRTDDLDLPNSQPGIYVLVTVEPAGVVAIPHAQERENVIFNIVCDELLLGIPHKAWWVGIVVLICIGLAFVIPYFIPSYLLQLDPKIQSTDRIVSKDS